MTSQIGFDIFARDRASAVFAKVGASADRAGGKFDKVGGGIKRMAGSGIAQLGALAGVAGVGAVIKSSVMLEASFSKTLRQISVATGAPKSAMKGLHDTAMRMGAQTVFSANESADAMLELAKSGISTRDIMKGGIQGTLTLAAAGGLDMANAATIASNAMNTFNLKGKDMGSIAAALAGGANASTASVESLGQALSQVGPGARNAGLSLQETVGTLAAFDQAGIKGSDAGTSLKTMLQRLIPQTTKAAAAMKKYNLHFTDAKGNYDSITTVAQKLHDKLGPLTQAQRNQALQTMFGSDATRAATVLMNDGAKGLAKFIKATRDQGAAQRMANSNMQGTAGALEQLSGSVDTAKLKIGEALAPTVRKFANYLSKTAVPAFSNFIGQMQSGKGTGGAVARDLGVIYQAAKKVVSIGAQVAHAFDGLPGGLKKAIAVAGIGALAANKVGLIGKGSVGGAVAKSVMGGIQKVFVVNEGFGKGGVGGALGGAGGAGGAARMSIKSIALRAGAVYVAAGLLGKLNFGNHGVKGDARAVYNSTKHPGATALDQKLAAPFGGDALTKQIANMKRLDNTMSHIAWDKPKQGAKAFNAMMDKTGLSASQLKKVLPKTAAAMDAVGRGGKAGAAGLSNLLGGAARARLALGKAGMSAKEYGQKLHSLPKAVQTKVTSPGAITSRAQVKALGKQYGLTPKQIRTIMQLSGVGAAASAAARARAAYNSVPRRVDTWLYSHRVTEFQNVYNPSMNKPRGHDAAGGFVRAGQPYVVGENGPETFVATQPGRIVNRKDAARAAIGGSGGGDGMQVTININGAQEPKVVAREVQQALLKLKRQNGGVSLGLA